MTCMYVCVCLLTLHWRTAAQQSVLWVYIHEIIHTFTHSLRTEKIKKKKQPNQTHAHIRIQNTQELNICNVDTGQSRAGVPDYNESWLGRFSSLHFSLSLTHSLNMCMCAVIVVVIAECRVFFLFLGIRHRSKRIESVSQESSSTILLTIHIQSTLPPICVCLLLVFLYILFNLVNYIPIFVHIRCLMLTLRLRKSPGMIGNVIIYIYLVYFFSI